MLKNNPKLIYLIALAHFTLFFWLTYIRWKGHTPTMDYHVYVQILWNTLHGLPLFYNQTRDFQVPMFSYHFSPILLLLFIPYALFQHPLTLYFLYNIAMSVSIIPLYFFSLDILKSKFRAMLVVFLLILYPAFNWSFRAGFAEEALAVPLLFFAFYSLHKKRYVWLIVFAFLTLSLRINMVLPVFMLGLYTLFVKKERAHGLFLCVISATWLFFILNVIIPKYPSPGDQPYIFGFFYKFGKTGPEILKNILFNWQLTKESLFNDHNLTYLFWIFIPTLFIPLLSPLTLAITIPTFVLHILATQ